MARKPFHLFRADAPVNPVPEAEQEDSYLEDYFFEQPGTMPGTLSIEADAPPPKIILIDYEPEQATRRTIETPEECRPYLSSPSVSWTDVQGIGDEDVMRRIGQVFNDMWQEVPDATAGESGDELRPIKNVRSTSALLSAKILSVISKSAKSCKPTSSEPTQPTNRD